MKGSWRVAWLGHQGHYQEPPSRSRRHAGNPPPDPKLPHRPAHRSSQTLTKLWSFTTGGVPGSPAVADGVVYIGSDNGKVYALNAATGAKLWSFTTRDDLNFSLAVANGVVYADSEHLYALNAATGAKLWSFAAFLCLPAVANGVLYINCFNNHAYAVNAATGAKLWNTFIPVGGTSSPSVANGVVYVGSSDNLYALNAATGTKLGSFGAGAGSFNSAPAVANGVVYIGTLDVDVSAFHLPGGIAAVNRPNPGQLHPNYALRPQEGTRT